MATAISHAVGAVTSSSFHASMAPALALALAAVGLVARPEDTELLRLFSSATQRISLSQDGRENNDNADATPLSCRKHVPFVHALASVFLLPELWSISSSSSEVASVRGGSVPSVVGNVFSNLSNALYQARLWPQCVVAAVGAALFQPDLAAKNRQRFALAGARLGLALVDDAACLAYQLDSTVEKLLSEQSLGAYDVGSLAKGGNAHPLGEYFAPRVVGIAGEKGYGLFTASALRSGDVVLAEHAVSYMTVAEAPEAGKGDDVVERLLALYALPCAAFITRRVDGMFAGAEAIGRGCAPGDVSPSLSVRRDRRLAPSVDESVASALDPLAACDHPCIFHDRDIRWLPSGEVLYQKRCLAAESLRPRLSRIVACNAYTLEHFVEYRPSDVAAVGLFPALALVNHDLTPNCCRCAYGNIILVRALRALAPGEEVTVSYVSATTLLTEDDPVALPWGIDMTTVTPPKAPSPPDDSFPFPLCPAPARHRTPEALVQLSRLRQLHELLGLAPEKLLKSNEAASLLGIDSLVDAPSREIYIANAGMFAAIAKQDHHPMLRRLIDLLSASGSSSTTPNVSVMELVARLLQTQRKKMSPAVVTQLSDGVAQWARIALGHTNLKAVARLDQ